MQPVSHNTIVIGSQKSVFVAFLLAFLFGPLGMFYSSVAGGLIMLIVSGIIALLTAGLGLLLTWPLCIVWAMIAASGHNRRLASTARGFVPSNSSVPVMENPVCRPRTANDLVHSRVNP